MTERKMKALKFPYTQADLDALKGKSEMDAMVAYMQKLGNDIPWRQAANTVVTGNLKNPFQGDAAAVAAGKEIFDKQCAQCHGADAQGGMGPGAKDMHGQESELFQVVYSGKSGGGMPAFGDSLGKEKIWKAITFIQSKQKR